MVRNFHLVFDYRANGDLIDARELCILAHSLYKNAISISPAIFIFNAVFVWAEGCI